MRRSLAVLVAGAVTGGALVGTTVAVAGPAQLGARPASEHVPTGVDHVRIAFRDMGHAKHNKTIVLRAGRARHMIALFNALEPEPEGQMHCLALGTARTTVTFKGPHHKWAATESICTNLVVTRDGDSQPTLLESDAWNDQLTTYLGHSPTGYDS